MFELIAEFVLQLLFEILLFWIPERHKFPLPKFLSYAFLGLMAGAISVILFPRIFIHSLNLQYLNLLLTPILIGAIFASFSALLASKMESFWRLEPFCCGYIFALLMALVRFKFLT